jgi:hypothetical protein
LPELVDGRTKADQQYKRVGKEDVQHNRAVERWQIPFILSQRKNVRQMFKKSTSQVQRSSKFSLHQIKRGTSYEKIVRIDACRLISKKRTTKERRSKLHE